MLTRYQIQLPDEWLNLVGDRVFSQFYGMAAGFGLDSDLIGETVRLPRTGNFWGKLKKASLLQCGLKRLPFIFRQILSG
jgi:hypothetical protein